MSLRAEIAELRGEMERMARIGESGLTRRYDLWEPPGQPRTLWRGLRRLVGRTLRRLRLRPTQPVAPWLPGLNYVEQNASNRPLVIWAMQFDRDRLRNACLGVQSLLSKAPDFSPVLITDVADFAFYSRLGWLIEYVPDLDDPAQGYAERKRHYLAWRYRDAPALPLSIGLVSNISLKDLLID